MPLLEFTDRGIYCAQADVYLDPWLPVKRALITHGHSDHARPGHGAYLCTEEAAPVIRYRLPEARAIETVRYGETRVIGEVRFSFYPAGHIPGSAQIRVAYRGEVWVFTGDFKLEADGMSTPFEPIPCHSLIMESTFGLPVYRWQPQQVVFDQMNAWWRSNRENGKVSVLSAYALGKAQRILRHLDSTIGPLFVHGAIHRVQEIMRSQGLRLPDTSWLTSETPRKAYAGGLVICPPAALGSPWLNRLAPFQTAVASGWMQVRGARRRRAADRGFVLSDHADWPGLNEVVRACGASQVWVTHGYADVFARWLREKGVEAIAANTRFEAEQAEETHDAV